MIAAWPKTLPPLPSKTKITSGNHNYDNSAAIQPQNRMPVRLNPSNPSNAN